MSLFPRSIRRTLTLHFLFSTLVPFVISGLIAIQSLTENMEQQARRRNEIVAEAVAVNVRNRLEQIYLVAEDVAQLAEDHTIPTNLLKSHMAFQLRRTPCLKCIRFLSKTDSTIITVIRKTEEKPDAKSMNDRFEGPCPIAPPLDSETLVSPGWTPVQFLPDQEILQQYRKLMISGALVLALDLTSLFRDACAGVALSPGTRIHIRDREGRALYPLTAPVTPTSADPSVHGEERASLRHLKTGYPENTGRALISRSTGTEFQITVIQSEEEMFGPLYVVHNIMYLGIGCGIMAALITALLTVRNIISPLNKLTNAVREIASGNYRFTFKSSAYQELADLETHFHFMARQIKDREARLQINERNYRTLFEESPISLWVEDLSFVRRRMDELRRSGVMDLREWFIRHPDELKACISGCRVLDVNHKTLEMYEAEDKDDFFAHLGEVIPADAQETLLDEFLEMLEKNSTEKEIRNYTLRGRQLDVSIKVSIPKGHETTWEQVFVSIYDLTRMKQAEAAEEKLKQQLRHARHLESLGTLAGGIAHDFNNLLMTIQGNASLLTTRYPEEDHPDTAHRLADIQTSVDSASELNRQLLGMARTGKYQAIPLFPGKLIQDTIRVLARTHKRIRVECRLPERLSAIEADPTQFGQILFNLFVNAAQSMPDGGLLTVSADESFLENPKRLNPELLPGPYVRIRMKDTGTGIAPDILDRIFDPFFTTRRKNRGTGMGLASVYGIVRSHQGAVTVDSVLGEGSEFTVYLPVTEKSPPKSDPCLEMKSGDLVLLADDEKMVLEVTTDMLEMMGFKVLAAAGGKEAVRLFEENRATIRMVILDMIMPDMDGKAVFHRLMELAPDIPVLISSGFSLEGEAAELMEAGCRGFLLKPYRLKELQEKLREAGLLPPTPMQ